MQSEPFSHEGCSIWLPALTHCSTAAAVSLRQFCSILYFALLVHLYQNNATSGRSWFLLWQSVRKAMCTVIPAFKCCVCKKEKVCAFHGTLLFPNALVLFTVRQRCQTGLCKDMEAKLSFSACVLKALAVPRSLLCFVFCSASACA